MHSLDSTHGAPQSQTISPSLVPQRFRGRHGTELHQDLLDIVRFDLAAMLREDYPDLVVQAEDAITRLVIETEDRLYPDAILFRTWREKCPPLLVEIGNFQPCKWPGNIPVLHVGKTGRASLLNHTGDGFELDALCVARHVLVGNDEAEEPESPELPDDWSTRDTAILALMTYAGLTAREISALRRRDVAEDGSCLVAGSRMHRLPEPAIEALQRHLRGLHRDLILGGDAPLFGKKGSSRVDHAAVHNMLRRRRQA